MWDWRLSVVDAERLYHRCFTLQQRRAARGWRRRIIAGHIGDNNTISSTSEDFRIRYRDWNGRVGVVGYNNAPNTDLELDFNLNFDAREARRREVWWRWHWWRFVLRLKTAPGPRRWRGR